MDNGNFYNGINPEYTYDKNGNLIPDVNKGITGITYNYLNLPVSVNKTGNMRVEYTYDAAGVKQQQKYYSSIDGTEHPNIQVGSIGLEA